MKVFALIVLAGLVSSDRADARSLEEIKKAGVLRAAADGTSPPFNFYQGKNLVGFEIDLTELMAKRLGVKVEWKVQNFNILLVSLSQGQFDIISTSHAVTPERQKVADFAEPHYCTAAVLVAKKNGPKSIKELKGKKVAVAVGTVYYDALKKHQSEIGEIRTVPTETDAIQNLIMDKVEAFATDQLIADEAVKKQKAANLVVGEAITQQRNAMVVQKGNESLLENVNQQLATILKDGSYEKLVKKWFERDIRCK